MSLNNTKGDPLNGEPIEVVKEEHPLSVIYDVFEFS